MLTKPVSARSTQNGHAMTDPRTLNALNRLLAAEAGSLIARLAAASPYTPLLAADDRRELDLMQRDLESHKRDIIDLIYDLRGVPVFPPPDPRVGGFHYVDLRRLMPFVLDNVRQLIGVYEKAGGTGHRETDALIARHLANYRRHLATLEKLHGSILSAK